MGEREFLVDSSLPLDFLAAGVETAFLRGGPVLVVIELSMLSGDSENSSWALLVFLRPWFCFGGSSAGVFTDSSFEADIVPRYERR